MKENCAKLLENLRKTSPLVHHLTNYVTVNACANICLGAGAAPIMADEEAEAADIARIANAVLINMGTANKATVKAMLLAGQAANVANIPLVLDPVGAGASSFRMETATNFVQKLKFSVVRGNISEINFLANIGFTSKGVDASEEDLKNSNVIEAAKQLAKKLGCVVAVTGAVDVISDGTQTFCVKNGHPMLAKVTGTGCMCSSLIACFCGCAPNNPLQATTAALVLMGIAGQLAHAKAGKLGNGSFYVALQDEVSRINGKTILEMAEIYEA